MRATARWRRGGNAGIFTVYCCELPNKRKDVDCFFFSLFFLGISRFLMEKLVCLLIFRIPAVCTLAFIARRLLFFFLIIIGSDQVTDFVCMRVCVCACQRAPRPNVTLLVWVCRNEMKGLLRLRKRSGFSLQSDTKGSAATSHQDLLISLAGWW